MASLEFEEIAEIKRYEDFSTIDWVQDRAREELRQRIKRTKTYQVYGRSTTAVILSHLRNAYEAAQGWLVVSCIGIAIGINAAMLNIITEWLSDFKLGYCETGFYLNESFCCWGAESGCPEWHPWTSFAPINYILFVIISVTFAVMAAFLVKTYAPYAAGSGISEIKCIVSGFVMKGYLGGWTLGIKSLGLPLAIASGLSVGKEGPSVHYAVCTGNVIARNFSKYRRNVTKMREILTACAATGVAVAFGSPIGGVLFSLEEISSHFTLATMWRSYFCALVGTATLAAMNPFRTGQLVMFQVRYDRDWHFFEILFYIILGIFGGTYGIIVSKWNLVVQGLRKKYLGKYAVEETAVLAGITAIICYFNRFLRIDMTESMEILFKECEGGEDYDGLCQPDRRSHLIVSLLFASIVRMLLVIISYGCKVPAGIFVPSMAIGALFGRCIGIIVQSIQEAHPDSAFFASCGANKPCIVPGTYAFLGAAAALSGIMNLTVSVVVIMFELTGALTYILPTMIVVGVTKIINDKFGRGGIADQAIWFNGYPFLDNKEEHVFGVTVAEAMQSKITIIPSVGVRVHDIETLLENTKYRGFPIVQDKHSMTLLGYIGRTELKYVLDRAKKNGAVSESTPCYFSTPDFKPMPQVSNGSRPNLTESLGENDYFVSECSAVNVEEGASSSGIGGISQATTPISRSGSISPGASLRKYDDTDDISSYNASRHIGQGDNTDSGNSPELSIDYSQFIDSTLITVNSHFALETVMEIFMKLGPSVILIENLGHLSGLITQKDLLKYQFKNHKHSDHS
ncbi:chloride channel [Dipodascopsis uninucleata]